MTAERPDQFVAVICGALYKAHQSHQQRHEEYKKLLQKGQNPSADLLKTDTSAEIIYENVKYSFTYNFIYLFIVFIFNLII